MEIIHPVAAFEQAGLPFTESTEQRGAHRHRLFNTINIAFYNQGKLYRGYMADLSPGGARLVLPIDTPEGSPDLSKGRNMECYLLNRHGSSKCRGTIQWMQCDGVMLRWGISFIELPVEEDDPLRKSIDEVCWSFKESSMTGVAVH